MTVETYKKDNVCVLEVDGELKHGQTTKLRDLSKQEIEKGERTFVLDLTRSRWIDSSGIGEVIALRHRIKEHDGRLAIALKEKVHGLFVNFELIKIVSVFTNVDEAIREVEKVGAL